ncbi:hypothetical protein ACJMK2_019454 [Sinanodonta woodiana]|uniref:G-protein coupled receptors family 1 profile domain-containing protein n=1 Tax=Sinanodonta woodiana TaxID=1069815 RepID=A0ABD3UJX6_SINWO
MNANENKSAWLVDIAVNNVSQHDLKFEMTGYIFTLYTLYLSGAMTVGVPGNFIVLAIYYKHKPSSSLDCYILSISVIDLVCLVVTVPMYIVIQTKVWDIIDINSLCKALNFTGQIVTFAESFLLCAMAIERFIKVCRPKSTFYVDRRRKYIVLSIILSTIFISVPNLFFSWIGNRRHCRPITNPPWVSSAFFLLTVSLFIAMFGIVSFSYMNVARTLFQSVNKTTQNSITSRTLMQRNKIAPLPCQTDITPTTSKTFEKMTNVTSLPVKTNVTSIHINVSSSSSNEMVTGDAVYLGKRQSLGNGATNDIKKENEDGENYFVILGKTLETRERLSEITVDNSSTAEPIATKVKRRENVIRESLENMSLPQKRRLVKTTKISFLITITFIISWLPVWVYTVLAYTKTDIDVNGTFFLKQSYLINTFMDPILYLACNRNFRNKVKGLFIKNESTITS